MSPRARRRILVAACIAALLLVVLLLRLHRAPQATDGVITHEVRDLIATIQGTPQAGDATPWNERTSPGLPGIVAACLALLGLAAAVWIRRRQMGVRRPPSSAS